MTDPFHEFNHRMDNRFRVIHNLHLLRWRSKQPAGLSINSSPCLNIVAESMADLLPSARWDDSGPSSRVALRIRFEPAASRKGRRWRSRDALSTRRRAHIERPAKDGRMLRIPQAGGNARAGAPPESEASRPPQRFFVGQRQGLPARTAARAAGKPPRLRWPPARFRHPDIGRPQRIPIRPRRSRGAEEPSRFFQISHQPAFPQRHHRRGKFLHLLGELFHLPVSPSAMAL